MFTIYTYSVMELLEPLKNTCSSEPVTSLGSTHDVSTSRAMRKLTSMTAIFNQYLKKHNP